MARIESGSEQTLTPAGEGYPVIISATAPTKVRFPTLIVGQLWLDTTVPQLKRCTNADTPTYTSAEGTAYTHPNHSGDVTSVADGAQTIAAAAVTLAMMANLAQDLFIGRTTASTGVPETATITAAARTVLDDVTVAAMVDTLGGAAATGTGGLARASSPTFVTPALGTPASGVLTNVTGLPTTGLVDDAVTLAKMAAGTDGNLITYDVNGDPAAVATGTAGQVLTSNGAGAAPTFQAAAAGGDPTVIATVSYETAARYVVGVTNQGGNTWSTSGVSQTTGAGATGGASCRYRLTGNNAFLVVGSPTISAFISVSTIGTDFDWICWLGTVTETGTAIPLTTLHCGFKITRRSSGTVSLYATQADGTTETASSALATVDANDIFELLWKMNTTASVDYYFRENGGARSSATNLATNVPATAHGLSSQITNADVASESVLTVYHMSYQR